MSWLSKNLRKAASISSAPFNALGVSSSNGLRQALDPGGIALQKYSEGGALNAGNALDPGGYFDKPDTEKIAADNAAKKAAEDAAAAKALDEANNSQLLAKKRRRAMGGSSLITGAQSNNAISSSLLSPGP